MTKTPTPTRFAPASLSRAQPTDTPIRRAMRAPLFVRRLQAALVRGASRPLGLLGRGCCA